MWNSKYILFHFSKKSSQRKKMIMTNACECEKLEKISHEYVNFCNCIFWLEIRSIYYISIKQNIGESFDFVIYSKTIIKFYFDKS